MPPPLATSKSNGISTKPLRLGTRSCIECRAHKVRCVFQSGQKTCDYCLKHNFFCQPQKVKQSVHSREKQDETAALKKRLQILENAVLQLSGTEDKSQKSINEIGISPNNTDSGTNFHESEKSFEGKSKEVEPPFIKLLAESRLLQESLEEKSAEEEEDHSQSTQRYIDFLLDSIHSLLNDESIRFILRATEELSPSLPPYYFGPTRAQSILPGNLEQDATLLINAIQSNQPALMAKAIAWIALCVQQLPLPEDAQRWVLQDAPGVLVLRYIKVAAQLLAIDDEMGCCIDGVECMMMLQEANRDIGKPKKAWLWTRQALSSSIPLGISNPTQSSTPRELDLWFTIMVTEKQLSVLLGLPSSIPPDESGIEEEIYQVNLPQRIMYKIGNVNGNVGKRDRAPENEQYEMTMKLDQEAIALQDLFPLEWWDENKLKDLDLISSFYQQQIKFQYFILLNMIHVPFMLKCLKDEKYIYNWKQSMAASRFMVQIYCQFRQNIQTKGHLCQLMDFYAFSAALTMIVGLKTCPSLSEPVLNSQDWNLIEQCKNALRGIATDMFCEVAGQGSNVLEIILKAHQGIQMEGIQRSSIIPYFGKVNINLNFFLDALNSHNHDNIQSVIPTPNLQQIDSNVNNMDYSSSMDISNENSHQTPEWTHLFTDMDFNGEMSAGWTFNDLDISWMNQNT